MSQRDTGQPDRNWKLYATPNSTSHTRTHVRTQAFTPSNFSQSH